jgi:IclR family acetate operon transcriptional repressor
MTAAASGAAGHRTERPGRVGSVAKATMILGTFSPLVRVLSLRQIVRRTGIPRSTAHGLCVTLCDAGLLEEVPHRGYQLGPALVALGGQVIDRSGLVEAADGVLERAVRHDGTEAHLGQLVGGWTVYLERRTGPHRAPMNNRVGLRAPAHRTGCGKAALSRLDPDEAAERVRATCATDHLPLPDLGALARELAAGRRRGWIASSDFQPDRMSVAAPVLRRGQVVGAISIAGPTRAFGGSALTRVADDVVIAAARISERLA